MNIRQIKVEKILTTITKKDGLFHGKYTIDPYQNCSFGCTYCDSSLENIIYVKTNALQILKNELKTVSNGRIIIGSVHDPYQPLERSFHLTRDILSFLATTSFPVHILTKSPDIINDLSIISKITKPIVTFTILGLNESFYHHIEPNAPPPLHRLQAMKTLRYAHILSGIAIIPVFPHFQEQQIEDLIKKAKEFNASYILYKPLFLQGNQKQTFLQNVKESFPNIFKEYTTWFDQNQYPPKKITDEISKTIKHFCNTQNLPTTLPTD